jgi:hypothetical protein
MDIDARAGPISMLTPLFQAIKRRLRCRGKSMAGGGGTEQNGGERRRGWKPRRCEGGTRWLNTA